jgi:hypothetical protein
LKVIELAVKIEDFFDIGEFMKNLEVLLTETPLIETGIVWEW